MLDSGNEALAVVNDKFAQNLYLTTVQTEPVAATGFNGQGTEIDSMVTFELQVADGAHRETINAYVVPGLSHDMMLGKTWLSKHGIAEDHETDTLRFRSQYCKESCLQANGGHEITVNTFAQDEPPGREVETLEEPSHGGSKASVLKPYAISALSLQHLAARSKKDPEIQFFAASIRDIEIALHGKQGPRTNPAEKLPKEYHQFLHLFDRSAADKLPPHRPGHDHEIKLQEGKQPPFGPLYNMSQQELEVLLKTLKEYLAKGFIRASSSPAAAPVLFAKKPGGGLRFCVDYRGLNDVTIKNRYPLPLFRETLDRLAKAQIFTKLDIVAAFHKLRVKKGDEWLTAFRTRWGLFEWLVMPFGLANAPASWQGYINDLMHDYLYVFLTIYVDDLLIFSDNIKDHKLHVQKVLGRLSEAGLQLDIDKCEFEVHTVK